MAASIPYSSRVHFVNVHQVRKKMSPWPAPLRFLLAFILAACAFAAHAQPSFGNNDEFKAISTFHSVGLYWSPQGKATTVTAEVRYKPQGESTYKRGLDLWYDFRNINGQGGEYRGSLVHLQPGITYDIELKLSSGLTRNFTAATWSETVTETVIDVNTRLPTSGYRRLSLQGPNDSGAPGNWKVYTAPAGSNTIDQSGFPNGDGTLNDNDNCINLQDVSYVIIRGLNLVGCTRSAINVFRSHHIIIEKNDISGWGRLRPDGKPQQNGAVHCNESTTATASKSNQLIIQDNIFHSPRHNSTTWGPNNIHPEGALAVSLGNCGSNHVIRYNDVLGAEGNYFMDAFGGAENFANDQPDPDQPEIIKGGGFPWADSDIYGNRIERVYDDAIEAEGDNRNVRIWENYVDRVFVVMGNAATAKGPLYVWRNVSNIMGGTNKLPICPGFTGNRCPAGTPLAAPDDEHRGPFVKGGGQTTTYRGGRAYYFHNTLLQPPAEKCGGSNLPCGGGWAFEGVETLYNFISLNNIWQIHKPQQINGEWKFSAVQAHCNISDGNNQTTCLLSHDLFNGGVISNGTLPSIASTSPSAWRDTTPAYAASGNAYPGDAAMPAQGNGWSGDFQLQENTDGHGDALVLFNFNDQHASPDVGAHQSGTPRMKFGRRLAAAGPNAVLNTQPSPASGPLPLAVTFTSNSTPGAAPITSQILNFGDGSAPITLTGASVSHTYTVAGNYTATLTVSDGANTDSDSVPISAGQCTGALPTASFTATPDSGNPPLTVNFDASASAAASPKTITKYEITYADGGSGIGVTQSHAYTASGQYIASLKVTDSSGCVSPAVTRTITVNTPPEPPGTVTLMQGQNYAGTTDTAIASFNPTLNRGEQPTYELINEIDSGLLVRFAIFQSEGGPVPNNATITSATLSFYKWAGAGSTFKASRLLKNWNESQANWNVAATGTNWTTPGARGAGSDYLAAFDGQASVGDASLCATGTPGPASCWLAIDVTTGVQAFRNGTANYGWKIAYVSGTDNNSHKQFHSSENGDWPTLRPKLTITYEMPPGPTVTLMQGQASYAGTTDTAIASFNPTLNRGDEHTYQLINEVDSGLLVRFAIFESEGGPVPNNATVTSATLSFYKWAGAASTFKASRLLKNWNESQANWNVAAIGTNWTTAGARGSGTDYLAAPDGQSSIGDASLCATGTPGPASCWLAIDVTTGVQAFRNGTANYGWKIAYVSGADNNSHKQFHSSENDDWPTLRPKLAVTYTMP
jgi:PKD repeat protein